MAASAFAAAPSAAAAPSVATVDWAVLETLLALDVVPVAATELIQFRRVAVEPPVPASVADLGLRGMVNFELLQMLRPELILISNFYTREEGRLSLIAPVENFPLYLRDENPYPKCEAMTRRVGERLGLPDRAANLVEDVNSDIAALRARLTALRGPRAVIPINLGDARHFRVFGNDSIFGEVLARLGLANAWTEATSYSAWAPVGLEALARVPDAWIVIIPPVPPDAASVLPRSAFWNALPNVRDGRVVTLASTNPFGALPTARRFARFLAEALLMAELQTRRD